MSGDGIYRTAEDRLGAIERDEEAVRVFGQWRDRTKATVLGVFGAIGIVGATVAYYVVQGWQLAKNAGVALIKVNAIVAPVTWSLVFVAGAFVARRVVRARTPAKLDELARAYEIPGDSLRQTAALVDKL